MPNDIYESMIQQRGREYRSDQIKPYSHYREPIDRTPGRLAGDSRVWGDASPEVQSRVIDQLIDASERAGLSSRETAHVLAIARIESGFNPDAAAGTTSASGLGQFVDRTGAGLRQHPIDNRNRFDVRAQSDALVEHFIENRDLARSRGQGEAHIYKYHHDGPTRDYGGLGLANREVVPRLDEYERFVNDRLAQRQEQPGQTIGGQSQAAAQPVSDSQEPTGPRSFEAAMRVMLPPQNGVNPHLTSDYGPRRVSNGSSDHRGVDFNYEGGQSGINLRHPTVRSPVSGTVEMPENSAWNTVGIRDGAGNLHQILHLDSRTVRNGQPIAAGDAIGTMGNTNNRDPNMAQHVHYQIRDPQNRFVDPERFWNNRVVEGSTRTGVEAQAPRTSAMADGVLKENDRGPEVQALQRSLNALGYRGSDGQPLETASGMYGPHTRHAVEAFQRAHGLKIDGEAGSRTLPAVAAAVQAPLLSEATHPNHRLYNAIARELPPGTRPEAAANVTLQAIENGVSSVEKLARVDVRGNDVFVMGTTPGDRARVDLTAPTPTLQQMSEHTPRQSRPPQTQTNVQGADAEALRPRTVMA